MAAPSSSIPPLLLWTDTPSSAAVFLPPLLLLVALTKTSLISVLAWLSLLLLAVVAGGRLYVFVMVNLLAKLPADSPDPLAMLYNVELTVPADRVAGLSHTATDLVNSVLGELKRLFLAESILDTAKFGLSLYCLTYIGSWFNLLTLVILAWCALFSLPRLYVNNQVAVDEVVASVMGKVNEVQGKMDEVKGKVNSVIPVGGGAKEE